ncbi:MAG: ribosome-associated translation inhibitor RaiA [Bacteriovoracaceae bacterium]|jgi:putative sigma-54 modulation protein|nr:ribosome-associated translation inhibitor RaiA [Bacteriovoracaceae bacterium]
MKIVSSFKHLEHTESLDLKIHEKSQKLKKFFEGNFEVQWTCHIDDSKRQFAELKIIGPQFEYHASAHSESMYKSLDQVISKIERQIYKKKDKWKNHISKKHNKTFKDQQVAQSTWDEQFWEDKKDIAS